MQSTLLLTAMEPFSCSPETHLVFSPVQSVMWNLAGDLHHHFPPFPGWCLSCLTPRKRDRCNIMIFIGLDSKWRKGPLQPTKSMLLLTKDQMEVLANCWWGTRKPHNPVCYSNRGFPFQASFIWDLSYSQGLPLVMLCKQLLYILKANFPIHLSVLLEEE